MKYFQSVLKFLEDFQLFFFLVSKLPKLEGLKGGADVPLFETIKTNAGAQLKNELQL